MQVPSNMLITRIKPGIYMSAWMLIWAVVSACTALVQNFGGLVACRFFLGITEAPVRFPSLSHPAVANGNVDVGLMPNSFIPAQS